MEQAINEERKAKVKETLAQFVEAMRDLLHNGSYSLDYVDRGITTGKVDSAMMSFDDIKVHFRLGQWNVILPADENPINEELLECWDWQSIGRDIEYHQRKLDELQERKQELEKQWKQ